jgi:hypothetical protein
LIVLGLLAGIASGFKIHGILYLLPSGFLVLSEISSSLAAARGTVIAGLICVGVIAIATIFDYEVVVNYINYVLMLAPAHPSIRSEFLNSFAFVLALFMLILLGHVLAKSRPQRSQLFHLAGLALAAGIALVPASKLGAGPHHMIPFIPHAMFMVAQTLDRPNEFRTASSRSLGARILVLQLVTVVLFVPQLAELVLELVQNQPQRAIREELVGISERYPEALIAPGSFEDYPDYFFQPIVVARTGKLLVDAGPYMDLKLANVSDQPFVEILRACRIRQWIVPGAQPWTMGSYFMDDRTEKSMFSDNLRNTFLATYRLVDRSSHYSVWQCD